MRSNRLTGGISKGINTSAAALAVCASLGNTQVTLRDSTYDWKTWNVAENPDHSVSGQNLGNQVTRHYKTQILENEFVRVTLLPDYGARILSIFYKPTGHEELFQNPVGFADGIGAGSFYYNWLMVLGGIFPTFPEPEHGKTYLLPWTSQTVENTPQRISVQMSITDNVDFPGRPGKFNIGVTGLTCVTTVSLDAGKSSVEMKVELKNAKAQSVRYEYWTCHALAPGSTSGDTKAPQSTEIVVPISRYSIGYGTDGIDKTMPDGFQEYKNLAFFKNWHAQGIAYAEPAITQKWWGVINHDNEEGLFRISSDPKQTPGMKFWTWGWQSNYVTTKPDRQFIELWAGANHQFFSPTQINANTAKSWTETYVPTVGLKAVTLGNENGLVSLASDKASYDGNSDKNITVSADIAIATPGTPYRARITAGASGNQLILDTLITPNPKDACHLSVTRPLSSIGSGQQTLGLRLETAKGDSLLAAGIPISVSNVSLSARAVKVASPWSARRVAGALVLGFADAGPREVRVYDVDRRLVLSRTVSGSREYALGLDAAGRGLLGVRVIDASGPSWRPLPPEAR